MLRHLVLVALGTSFLSACGSSGPDTAATASTGAATTSGTGGSGGAATSSSSATGGAPFDFCAAQACGAPADGTVFANVAIDEASGVVASSVHAGVYYLHNDSGAPPQFFATNFQGEDLGTFDVTGATALDWEDIARGPCPAGSCLFLGDVGDNSLVHDTRTIYRVTEPSTLGAGSHSIAGEALPFKYPDAKHNCETLLVHPLTGVISVVTKVPSGPSGIYEFPMPLTPGVTVTLVKKGEVTPPSGSNTFTAGDVHPAGLGVLLRTYDSVFFFPATPSQTAAQALAGTPCSLPAPLELQGEAIGFLASGAGYVTTSEFSGQRLREVVCGP